MIIKGGKGWDGVGIVRRARRRRGREIKRRSGIPLGRRESGSHGIGWNGSVLLRMLRHGKVRIMMMMRRRGALRTIIRRARHRRGLEIEKRRGHALGRRGSESHGVG